jgi:hypothetical protein
MELKPFLRTHADRVLAGGLVLLGVIAVALGWIGASGTGLAVKQIPYLISGGIGGVVLIVIGCTVWVSADLQDEWRRLSIIEDKLDRLTPAPGVEAEPEAAPEVDAVKEPAPDAATNGKGTRRGGRVRTDPRPPA